MAQFDASIGLKIDSAPAIRQLNKVERNVRKIEKKTEDILTVDKQIIRERRVLIRLSGEQARKAQQRIKDLSLQKTELALQKRELNQINRLEKQRVANARRASSAATSSGAADAGSSGIGGTSAFAGGLVAAKVLSPKKLIQKSKALQGLEEFRDRQSDALDSILEDLDEAQKKFEAKLNRFNEVRAKRPLLTSKGTFQPTTRTSRNAMFGARSALFETRADAASQKQLVGGINDQIAGLTKELDAAAKASTKAQGAFSGLGRGLAALGAVFGAFEFARFIGDSFRVATAVESQRIRLKALSNGLDDFE